MSEWQEGEKYNFLWCVCGFQTDTYTRPLGVQK